ncbi:MAG: hypothetical protein KF756_13445 [Acidobacteria bacterium]|nr:hypothetical protein [Acidobacteriota bacterium]
MKAITRSLIIVAVAGLALFAAACPEKRSIAEINANPSRYQNKEVGIIGTVTDSYGLSIPGTGISGGAYKIDDGTGSIWVVTDRNVPARGSRIGISGTVGTGVSYKGRNYGLGIFEKERRYKGR